MKILLIFALLYSTVTFAQQEPISGMYWNNYSFSNPAMSAVKQKHEANITNRSQWSRVNNNPKSWFVNYAVNLGEKHGLGMNYFNENGAYSQTNRVKMNYNYQFDLKEERTFVIGAALNFSRKRCTPDWCFAPCVYFAPKNIFEYDLGMAYYSENIIAGLAITQLPISKRSNSTSDSSACSYNRFPVLTGNFRLEGALFDMPKFIFETKIQTDFVNYQQDFNIGYKPTNFLEVGVGYRTSDAVLVNLTGTIAKKIRVGYSYAHSVNKLEPYSRSTHEIAIGLRIPNK